MSEPVTGGRWCPVCGWDREEIQRRETCPSCGVKFQYLETADPEDRETRCLMWSSNWILDGMPWRAEQMPRPEGWNPEEQVLRVRPAPPLHRAAGRADFGELERLLASGTNINEVDAVGFTPLHLVVFRGQRDVVEFLLERGADPNVPLRDGVTPLWSAEDFGLDDIASLLRRHGGIKSTGSHAGVLERIAARLRGRTTER